MRFLSVSALAASVAMCACHGSNAVPPPAAAPAPAGIGHAPEETAITIPAGTTIPIVLETSVGSAISRVKEPVRAHVASAVMVGGVAAIPDGSPVDGVVTDARRSERVKGRAHVALRFDAIRPAGGDSYPMRTAAVARTAKGTTDKDAVTIAASAVGGAVVGSLVGGGKGAAIGAAAGGGAGTGVVLSTRGQEIRLGTGSRLSLRLLEPLTVKVRS